MSQGGGIESALVFHNQNNILKRRVPTQKAQRKRRCDQGDRESN